MCFAMITDFATRDRRLGGKYFCTRDAHYKREQMRVSHRLSSSVSLAACMQLFVSKQKGGDCKHFLISPPGIESTTNGVWQTFEKRRRYRNEKRDEPLPTAILQIGNGMKKEKILADFADCVLCGASSRIFLFMRNSTWKEKRKGRKKEENWSETFLNV